MRIYPVNENPIGSAVSEILRYNKKQTDRQIDRHRSTLYYRYPRYIPLKQLSCQILEFYFYFEFLKLTEF